MNTQSIIIPDLASTMAAISEIAKRSAWFCFEPLPDYRYRIEFKTGEGHYEFLEDLLGGEFHVETT